MKLTFLGAAGTLTGSKYLLEGNGTKILIDCGLFQGFKNQRLKNWAPLPFLLEELDAVILTHAHLDHSGYLPLLFRQGYRGPVFCHPATEELCGILLPDSGYLQEEDAAFHNRHKSSRHHPALPLYTRQDAEDSLTCFEPVEFHRWQRVKGIRFFIQPVGHILGAGAVLVDFGNGKIVFSGDVGRPRDAIMQPPEILPAADYLLIESTYGNRRHEQEDPVEVLADRVNGTFKKGGTVVVPSFAVGRAQLLQHLLTRLMENGRIPTFPVFLDSPMAIDVSDIYCKYQKYHRLTNEDCGKMKTRVKYLSSVEDSKSLAKLSVPHIILAGSGMATGGRVLHHLKRLLGDWRNTVLLVGYQVPGTRGARLLNGASTIKIHGSFFPVRAQVESLPGLSAHADYVELGDWLENGQIRPRETFVVHGEPDAADHLRSYLENRFHWRMTVPEAGMSVQL